MSRYAYKSSLIVIFTVLAFVMGDELLAQSATATYVGSFKAATGYYYASLAFVPADMNATRPAGKEINVPTLITAGNAHTDDDDLKEWYIPADNVLAKIASNPLPSATQVTP